MTPPTLHPRFSTSILPKKNFLMPPLAFDSHMMTVRRVANVLPARNLADRTLSSLNYNDSNSVVAVSKIRITNTMSSNSSKEGEYANTLSEFVACSNGSKV
jgi:hypothetical protein